MDSPYETHIRKISIPTGGYVTILLLCLFMTMIVCH